MDQELRLLPPVTTLRKVSTLIASPIEQPVPKPRLAGDSRFGGAYATDLFPEMTALTTAFSGRLQPEREPRPPGLGVTCLPRHACGRHDVSKNLTYRIRELRAQQCKNGDHAIKDEAHDELLVPSDFAGGRPIQVA